MRTFAHLGNLFIGWTSPGVLHAMADMITRLQPDVVAVSGNLTASGQLNEMKAAKNFLQGLPSPQILVPGEKDTPTLVTRLLSPRESFSREVEASSVPCFADRELVVVGVNTSKSVRVREEDRRELTRVLETSDPQAMRVLVSFRPVFLGDRFDPQPEDERVFRSIFDCQLCGPIDASVERSFRPSDTTHFIGCANRPEGLGFNLLRLQKPEIVVERYGWQNEIGDFRLASSETFRLSEARWTA